MVQMLLDKGANVNAQGGSYGNALYAASGQGSVSMRATSDWFIKGGVLWLYPRSRRPGFRRPGSLLALLSHCREFCALTKASRSPLDSLPLLRETPFPKETSSVFVRIFA